MCTVSDHFSLFRMLVHLISIMFSFHISPIHSLTNTHTMNTHSFHLCASTYTNLKCVCALLKWFAIQRLRWHFYFWTVKIKASYKSILLKWIGEVGSMVRHQCVSICGKNSTQLQFVASWYWRSFTWGRRPYLSGSNLISMLCAAVKRVSSSFKTRVSLHEKSRTSTVHTPARSLIWSRKKADLLTKEPKKSNHWN